VGVPPPPPETTSFDAWHRIPCDNIEAIKTAIMTYGVVDAAVYVGSAFQAYGGGIYEDSRVSCDSSPCYYTSVNHAIALVGWNDNGDPDNEGYWILRNSRGTSWGEDGYMRIKYRSARVACEGTYFVLEQVPVCEEDDISGWSTSNSCSDCAFTCDMNGDGEITPQDALCAFQKYMGICPTSCGDCSEILCDVNQDGECTPADALEIFREYMGEPSVCSPQV